MNLKPRIQASSALAPNGLTSRGATRNVVLAVLAGISLLLLGGVGFIGWRLSKDATAQASAPTKAVHPPAPVTPLNPGLPNTLAELNAWYVEPPEGQNAATHFARGMDAIQITEADYTSRDLPIIGKGELPELGRPLPPQTKAAIAAFVQRNTTVLDAYREGMRFEKARYPSDLNQGIDTKVPHLAKQKRAAHIAQLSAILHAENKQPQAATENLLILLAGAQSLKDEPLLISQLVRVACFGIAKEALERVLNTVSLPKADLERLANVLDAIEAELAGGTAFTRAIAGERIMALHVFGLPNDRLVEFREVFERIHHVQYATNSPSWKSNDVTRNLDAQRAFIEETFNQSFSLRNNPFPDRLEVDNHFATASHVGASNDFSFAKLLPSFSRAAVREAAALLTIRRMQTAIALERYRAARENRYPFSLHELVPDFLAAVPHDPFDGKPLSYARNGDSYEMHSAGAEPAKPFRMIKAPRR